MGTVELIVLGAVVAAGAAGFGLAREALRLRTASRHRASLVNSAPAHGRHGANELTRSRSGESLGRSLTDGIACAGGFERAIVELMAMRTLAVRMGRGFKLDDAKPTAKQAVQRQLAKAGLGEVVTVAGYQNARLCLGLGCGIVGAIIGFTLSMPLALVLGCVGLLGGWMAPQMIVKSRCTRRADELEHHLPETLDVIALGLRGGLSFDRSLRLYTEHFSSDVSTGLALAENQWVYGLMPRAEALRMLAATYDSPMFARVVENIIRSLRFGSSLAESLESTAVEARQTYQAKKQEQVAKAPIKIMIPTGALILPAMLLLVLGPVLLELIGSF